MEVLDKKYLARLKEVADLIQGSEALQTYLDTEEEEDFKLIVQEFEPQIREIHEEVARNHPLQLVAFEKALLEPQYEGMYLPRILGYCVLRGELNEHYKYIRPQNHFKDVLRGICESSNFEVIKQRIGQTLQIGFALSSDIWVTNFIDEIPLKSVRYFLESKKNEKYRVLENRKTSYLKYQRQYQSLNFLTAEFPKSAIELKILAPRLRSFLLYRSNEDFNNDNLIAHIKEFLNNKELRSERNYLELLMIIAMTFDLQGADLQVLTDSLESLRENYTKFEATYFEVLDELYDIPEIHVAEADARVAAIVDKLGGKGDLTKYYETVHVVHSKGYVHEDAIEAVRTFYYQHQGLSDENECLRKVIFSYFANFLLKLDPKEYSEYMEIMKTMIVYIGIFSNQKFNLGIKTYSLQYIKKLIKTFTDKRGRDYQDIKKFVKTTFLDLGFMKEKQIVELFKTRRKKSASK